MLRKGDIEALKYYFLEYLNQHENMLFAFLLYSNDIKQSDMDMLSNFSSYGLKREHEFNQMLNMKKIKNDNNNQDFAFDDNCNFSEVDYSDFYRIWEVCGQTIDIVNIMKNIDYYRKMIIMLDIINNNINSINIEQLNEGINNFIQTVKNIDDGKVLFDNSTIYTPDNIIKNLDNLFEVYENFLFTGITPLDNLLNGFKQGSITVIAATPGTGKTAFILKIIQQNIHLAVKTEKYFLFFTPDMAVNHVYERLIKIIYKKSIRDISKDDLIEKIQSIPIIISEVSSIEKICSIIEKYKNNINMIVIDYIQLIKSNSYYRARYEEITSIVNVLKNLCIQYNIVLVLISQVNREHSKRSNNSMLGLTDLKDCSHLEQVSDVVLFLNKKSSRGHITLSVAKNRHGSLGECHLLLLPQDFSFVVAEEYVDKEENNIDEDTF
ncbi:Replicative DNA helicase [bacterium AB1]|nr:Replicative DNA helicase [bacterium AB1]